MTELGVQTFEFEGSEIAYRREGSGRPIVFYPNAFTCHHLFDHQMDHFCTRNDVIALNPLALASDRADRDYPSDLYVRLLGRLIDDLELAPAILVGNCVGSLASLHYAARHPEDVSSLVLINTHTKDANAAEALGPLTEAALQFAESRDVPRAYMRDISDEDLEQFPYIVHQFGDSVDEEYRAHTRELFDDPALRLTLVNVSYSLDTYVLPEPDRLRGLPPVCWIWGEKNRIFPLEEGTRMAAIVKPTKEYVVKGGGHALVRERPGEVNRIIEAFLARNLAGNRGLSSSSPSATTPAL